VATSAEVKGRQCSRGHHVCQQLLQRLRLDLQHPLLHSLGFVAKCLLFQSICPHDSAGSLDLSIFDHWYLHGTFRIIHGATAYL
jgi:hypothetical protein